MSISFPTSVSGPNHQRVTSCYQKLFCLQVDALTQGHDGIDTGLLTDRESTHYDTNFSLCCLLYFHTLLIQEVPKALKFQWMAFTV